MQQSKEIRPAAACVDITEMPLAVTLLSDDPLLTGATLRGGGLDGSASLSR